MNNELFEITEKTKDLLRALERAIRRFLKSVYKLNPQYVSCINRKILEIDLNKIEEFFYTLYKLEKENEELVKILGNVIVDFYSVDILDFDENLYFNVYRFLNELKDELGNETNIDINFIIFKFQALRFIKKLSFNKEISSTGFKNALENEEIKEIIERINFNIEHTISEINMLRRYIRTVRLSDESHRKEKSLQGSVQFRLGSDESHEIEKILQSIKLSQEGDSDNKPERPKPLK